jgi:integrase
MGYKGIATAHGFRALFSTVANEAGWKPDAIERQLAHMERNKIRAAYHRSTYTDDRKKMMQWWADYIDEVSAGGTVVAVKFGKKAA